MFFLKDLPSKKILSHYAERFVDMDVDVTMQALIMMRSASKLIRRIDNYFTEHGLSQTRFLILIVLDREIEKKSLSITEIVERLDVSKSIITNTLKSLEQQGFLAMKECSHDKRSKKVKIMARGRKKLEEVLPGYYQVINKTMLEL